jgi:hypothetical protein
MYGGIASSRFDGSVRDIGSFLIEAPIRRRARQAGYKAAGR